jgi:hypothetical protein
MVRATLALGPTGVLCELGRRKEPNLRSSRRSRSRDAFGAFGLIAFVGWDSEPSEELTVVMTKRKRREYRGLQFILRAATSNFPSMK